ncbi:hypothetical protein K8I61_01545 [bacterium]|nr:hypothetical protein [bacterium]
MPSRLSLALLILAAGLAACAGDYGLQAADPADAFASDLGEPFVSDAWRLTFLDVGAGSATLVAIPAGSTTRHLLIDGGPPGAGRDTICPLLDRRNIELIDIMVLTIPDPDHSGGLPEVFDCASVAEIWTNGDADPADPAYRDFIAAYVAWGGPVRRPESGLSVRIGNASLVILNAAGPDQTGEDGAFVLRIEHEKGDVVLGGQASPDAQDRVAAEHPEMVAATIAQVPRGGAAPFSDLFASLAAPEIAVVSTASLPADAALAAWRSDATTIYVTAFVGTVDVRWDEFTGARRVLLGADAENVGDPPEADEGAP